MEATPEQAAEGLAICRVLASVLDRLVQANTHLARLDPGNVTRFHAMKAPGIGIQQYLERVHKYASCSNECFILALIYVDRLIQRSNFLLTELNVHRVVITSILLAAKFFDDAYYNNAYYAKVGGVLVSEMNGLEVDFLFRINFSLHVTPDVFEKYRTELMVNSSTINNAVMQPIMETMSTQVYSPQTVPMPTDTMQAARTQITPSPPTPVYVQHLPHDYTQAAANLYVAHQHAISATTHSTDTNIRSQQLQALGYPSVELQQPHEFCMPVDVRNHQGEVKLTPTYYPQPRQQYVVDAPFHNTQQDVLVHHHYHVYGVQQTRPVSDSSWNYAMMGVSGVGM